MTTPIADMVERMLRDGVSHETIVLAVRTAESVTQRDVTERYAQRSVTPKSMTPGAIRARRFRENHKPIQSIAEANDAAKTPAQTVTPERYAQRYGVTPPCDLSSSLLPSASSKEATKERKKKEGSTGARGTRLSADAQITPEDSQFTIDHGLDPKATWPEFVDYWIAVPGSRGRKLNWSATYRNRVRDIAGRSKGHGPPPRQQQPSFLEIAAELRSKINGHAQVQPTDSAAPPVVEGEIIAPPMRSVG